MPKYLYHLGPASWSHMLQSLAGDYQLIKVEGGAELRSALLPGVIVAEADDDSVQQFEQLISPEEPCCIVQVLRSGTPYTGVLSDRVFALLPEEVPLRLLAKTLAAAFESLQTTSA